MKSIINSTLILIALLFSISCSESFTGSEPDIADTLDSVEDVKLIKGAENASIIVNKNHSNAYFNILFGNIDTNNVIGNGEKVSWCIDWTKPIDSNEGSYNGITLYSTDLVEKWKPVNYLLNITEELRSKDPELTWREFQIVIWSLRANPEFNIDNVAIEDLPSRFRTESGEANFSIAKVKQILATVEAGYRDFNFTAGTRFAVIAETPVNIQTVFAVVEK